MKPQSVTIHMKPFQLYFHMALFGFRYFFQNENLIVFLNLDLSSPGTERERGEGCKSSVLQKS